MKESFKRKIKTLIKILITLIFLYLIFSSIGVKDVIKNLNKVYLPTFFVVVLIEIFGLFLRAKKWQILLNSKVEEKRYYEVFKVYMVGVFFNMFLPTNVGGDVVKAHKMSRNLDERVEAYSSVVMERFTGLLAIYFFAIIATTIYFETFPDFVKVIIYLVFTPSILLFLLFIWNESLFNKFLSTINPIFDYFNPFSIREKIKKFYFSINSYKLKKEVFIVFLISLIFQFFFIFNNYLLATSIGLNISLHYFFVFIPISVIILFLPISIRGLGVREAIYAYFFTQVGATFAEAVSLSILVEILFLIKSLIGAGFYLFTDKKIL